ncbi:hypothetical protein BJY00DRAFT_308994 [Aspergillus carlsbadensis]|nr:hypothetical protein BJY00DRAFT_308994 [Aspergillus carlsbadensis]
MHHRRTHRKSKNGCLCDEVKPRCTNCIRFCVPCSFDPASGPESASSRPAPTRSTASPGKRGRGRPRKEWGFARGTPGAQEQLPEHLENPERYCSLLDISDLELLLHFTSHTGRSLAHPDPPDNPVARFWSHNVPRIGLSCHVVLHLALALAGHHLAYTTVQDTEKRTHYTSLAQKHSAVGLVELTKALASINSATCGALYTAATLMTYCTFASGPTDDNDLLVCNIGSHAPQRWMSVIQGVRLIRERFELDILFSGLLAPLAPSSEPGPSSATPACVEEGYPRFEWEEPFRRLRDLITSDEDSLVTDTENVPVYLEAYERIKAIYEATFGNADGQFTCPPENKFIFIWLYTVEQRFVACLQQRRPLSLLILAYYALLLTTMKRDWFMRTWPRHLLARIRGLLGHGYGEWLRWPLEQAGLCTDGTSQVAR